MGQRILKSQSNALNNSLGQLDNFYQPIGSVVNVYKFRKVSGSIYLTRFGEKELEVDVNDYNQTFEVYTGKEPVVVVWEGSFKSWVDEQTDKIIKQYSVGEYEQCYLNEAQNIQSFNENINLYGKDYVMSMIKNNISLQSTTWNPDENDMRDYLYVILDKKTKCIKWLEITSITPVFNEETNNLQYVDINFETINNKYTKTGKSILDFIQLGAIGEGYAFPTEKTNSMGEIEVGYDLEKVIDIGVNSLQYDFTCGAANSSFLVIGRRKSKDIGNGKFEVDKPHFLFLYKTLFPKPSKFFYNQPNSNSYIGTKFQPTKEGIWKSYKENPSSNNAIGDYNILNTKEVLTGLKMVPDLTTIRNSNKNMNTQINWDNLRTFIFKSNLDFQAIPYVKSTNIDKNVSYAEFFNINAFVNFYTDVFNYDYKETTKYKLTDTLGILGGIVNILVGGLDIGWTSQKTLASSQDINLVLPCISLEDGMSALNENAPLPLDVFMEDKSKSVLPTSTNVLTSWRFSLTDRIQDTSQVREGVELGKGKNGVWDLKYLGQTKFEDGTYINLDQSPFEIDFNFTKPMLSSADYNEFVIDYIDYKVISNCDVRISAFDIEEQSVYSSIMETNGKARGDIRIWGNSIKFNYYDKFNTTGQVKWPETTKPKKPNIDNVEFIIEDSRNSKLIYINEVFDDINREGWNGTIKSSPKEIVVGNSPVSGNLINYFLSREFVSSTEFDGYVYKTIPTISECLIKSNETRAVDINSFDKMRIVFFDDNEIIIPFIPNTESGEIIVENCYIEEIEQYAASYKKLNNVIENISSSISYKEGNNKLILNSQINSINIKNKINDIGDIEISIDTILNTLSLKQTTSELGNYVIGGRSGAKLKQKTSLINVFDNVTIKYISLLPKEKKNESK